MSVELHVLTEHHLEFLSLKGDCKDSPESTHAKIPHGWKSHVAAHLLQIDHCQILMSMRIELPHFQEIILLLHCTWH